jgi:Glycosyl transferase family 2.
MFREMKKFIILIPVYNDWKSLFKLLENINREISDQSNLISVLVVNDKSTEEITNNTINFSNLDYVQIINLKKMVVMVMQSQLA